MTGGSTVAVGVDIGTTETKALVIAAEDGRRLGFARQPTSWTSSPDGRVETSAAALAEDLLATVSAALTVARGGIGKSLRVTGIGLTGLGESGVLLDPAGRVLAPVIAWFDQRGEAELAAAPAVFRAAFPGRVGLSCKAQCTLAKLLWLRGQGIAFPPGTQWLNVPEYLAHVLGAARVTEPSLASRTGLLDLDTDQAWPEALDLIGVDAGFLPPLRAAGRSAGTVRHPGSPDALRGAEITVAGHDHPVAAVGCGVTGANELFNSTGTADVLLRSVPRRLAATERAELVAAGYSAGRHVLPGFSVLIGGTRGGLVLRRVLALLGMDSAAGKAALDRNWRPDAAGSGAVQISGVRNTDAEVTIRVRDGASPDAAWAAAISAVGAETARLLAAADRIVGAHTDAVAAGGWVRLGSVRDAKCRVIPGLRFADVDQPGAVGAALFAAWAGAGNPGSFEEFSRVKEASSA